jgi:4-hydroxy-3-polyprenylbenzoate decarboxylase
MQRIVLAITGATGAPLAIKVLQYLRELEVEIHLVVSTWAKVTLQKECGISYEQVCAMADVVHDRSNQGASISSGSFHVDGMVVVPCSMKTLAAIRHGYAENLISRTADVMLKERRRLVLVTRETPLNTIHLENMLGLSRMGCVIFPPTPAFYNNPSTLDDALSHLATRILDQFNLTHPAAKRWDGMHNPKEQ